MAAAAAAAGRPWTRQGRRRPVRLAYQLHLDLPLLPMIDATQPDQPNQPAVQPCGSSAVPPAPGMARRLARPDTPAWPGNGEDDLAGEDFAVPGFDADPVVVVDLASVTVAETNGTCVITSCDGELLGVARPRTDPPVSSGDAVLDAQIDAALAAMADPVWAWRGLVFAAMEDAAATCRLTRGTVTGPLAWFDADRGHLGIGPSGGPVFHIDRPVTIDQAGSVAWVEPDGASVVIDGRRFARVDPTADLWQVAAVHGHR